MRSERLASKRLKAEESYVNGSVDNSRISNLSDELLHKIFSFLNMDIVVRTSILSKRWRYLWKSTPTLNFHITGNIRRTKSKLECIRFVEHVLSNRYRRYKLEKFNLKSEQVFSVDSHLHKWINAATMSTVDELCLDIHSYTSAGSTIQLPDQVFKSGIKKLSLSSSLRLYSHSITCLPKSMCSAEHIKSLRLQEVSFPGGYSDNSQLILNCPVLENLIVKRCRFHYRDSLTISTPKLKSLEFYKWKHEGLVNKTFCCPKLTSFYWSGNIEEEISFKDISALTSVTLKDVCFDYRLEPAIQAEVNVIKHLLKEAKVLTKMVVYFKAGQSISYADRLAEYEQKVLALPAASSNLSISFSSSRML